MGNGGRIRLVIVQKSKVHERGRESLNYLQIDKPKNKFVRMLHTEF